MSQGREHFIYHLHHYPNLVTIIEQVTRLALINSNNTKQQLTAQTQGYRGLTRRDNGVYTVGDIGLQNVFLGELALEVGRKPDAGERPTLLEQSLGVEHDAVARRRDKQDTRATRSGSCSDKLKSRERSVMMGWEGREEDGRAKAALAIVQIIWTISPDCNPRSIINPRRGFVD
jgi:hypothetical protein